MQVAFFSTKSYDRTFFDRFNNGHSFTYFENKLDHRSVALASDHDAVCVFVNDVLDQPILEALAKSGIRLIALRCAGYNNVDLDAAKRLGIGVVRVPAYSPHAVAEHAVALILTLNRKTHKAYNRVREGNFSLERLEGFDLYGKTVGVVGTGKIGEVFAGILQGFGCRVLAYDPYPNAALESRGIAYVEKDTLLAQSDILSLHCPLTPETHHFIDEAALQKLKPGMMLINTSRGALIDTHAVVKALKDQRVGYLGIDVYEQEADFFFQDLSDSIIHDDLLMRLLTFPNVLITSHQGFFTEEALTQIAQITLANLSACEQGKYLDENTIVKPA
ncbi:2-hydroxyacid dehydrogenase [Rhabdobacter roseus]|uniref:D-lactate dehydrogenase n=1 Tax=Rhabdobacter roseus TaxID=1655419 RepID=A0A840TQ80_9BACT|nr:2-hydroxyacid dehydrogenase [Rhabdobacter roseus]MBB5283867.1 D-lactate dehydrogenase [Rhabdobacter roseus]